MADRIRLLPEPVANQIAAGEVVNRPSSVVKELLENAVDAGGQNITVNFRDGGKALVQVIDDGCGMSPNDARLAFDRHATSKIADVEDIYHLSTFGFRGEALASIASVAEVELRTRQAGDELGTSLRIAGGKFVSQSPVNCPVGSQFLIKNLFYNVPARRRFLDQSSRESRHIVAEYQRVALVNPQIAFSLYDSDSLISKLPASGLRQRIVDVIGKSIAKNLLEVKTDTSIVKVEGFVGRPASAKQTNREQFFFVNGRYFKSPYFHKAVISAYEKLIPANTQPSYFIYLQIDPQRIDVNVHPQKTEVKFSDGPDMWQIINAAVRESLAKSGAVPPMDFDIDSSVEIPVFRNGGVFKQPEIKGNPDFNPFERYGTGQDGGMQEIDQESFRRDYEAADYKGPSMARVAGLPGNHVAETPAVNGYNYVDVPDTGDYESSILEFISGEEAVQGQLEMGDGALFGDAIQLSQRYMATVSDRMLVVVDIPRACECILYDRYLGMFGSGAGISQQLLFPDKLIMSMDDYSLLKEHIDDFRAFGFDISFCDEHTIEVLGLPADFTATPVEELVYELLDALRDQTGEGSQLRRLRVAAAMARLGSVSRMRNMGTEELKSLLDQLERCSSPSFTPSGNAVMTIFAEEEIRRRLK